MPAGSCPIPATSQEVPWRGREQPNPPPWLGDPIQSESRCEVGLYFVCWVWEHQCPNSCWRLFPGQPSWGRRQGKEPPLCAHHSITLGTLTRSAQAPSGFPANRCPSHREKTLPKVFQPSWGLPDRITVMRIFFTPLGNSAGQFKVRNTSTSSPLPSWK